MRIPGRRVVRERWVYTRDYVVAVEVEAVLPPDDPSEPCYEAETVQFLREVERHAKDGDLQWLRKHGRVYQSIDVG